MKTITAIHQFSVSCSPGDGISNSMRFIQRLVRQRGLDSEIYVMDRPEAMRDEVRLYEAFNTHANELLLIHHGGGNPAARWLRQLPCAKVLVYHNITPERFFSAYDPLRPTLAYGREQLIDWKDMVEGVIAVSSRNQAEVIEAGYASSATAVIPLLVDLARFSRATPRKVSRDRAFSEILFVGRLMPHKNQPGLVAMLGELLHMADRPVHLTLVGDGQPSAIKGLHDLAAQLGVASQLRVTGKVSDDALRGLYERADLYVSMSEHEGFGMPLIEAMVHELPILAYAAPETSLVETIGGGGVLLESADPAILAAAAAAILGDPSLQAQLIEAQKSRLRALEPEQLDRQLIDFLKTLGMTLGTVSRQVVE